MKTFALAAALAMTVGSFACASAAIAQDSVSVMSYALSHPVDNSSLPNAPSLGDSVPRSVNLQRVEGARNFGYFYYGGQPVLVDLKTRSIVRIGQ